MENKTFILALIDEREQLKKELTNLVFGSIEIREKKDKKLFYIHYREEGIAFTKYLGEYTDELYNLVLNNTIRAKNLKKKIKQIDKQLKELQYTVHSIEDKVSQNIDFARKHLVSTIYDQAVLEGIATTYADTETIIEGGKVNNMTVSDVLKVVNLKHAWEFVLNRYVISNPTDFTLLCEINKLVEEGFYYNAGRLRTTPVSIGGTKWKPTLPSEGDIKEEINTILHSNKDKVDIAIELLLYVMKKQIFIDGNKRTAVIFANHYLISHAKGLIVIPDDKVEQYKQALIAYYEGIDEQSIKHFLKKYAYIDIEV